MKRKTPLQKVNFQEQYERDHLAKYTDYIPTVTHIYIQLHICAVISVMSKSLQLYAL